MAITVSSGLNAAIAGTANKIDYVAAMISVLGVSRTMTCKRSASAGDVWATGTTFYAATCGGTMVGSAGALTSLGVVSAIATRLSADLSTGYSVVRIEGGGQWLQGTLGLTGSGADFILARSPSGLYSLMPSAACKIPAPASLPASPDVVLATLTLRNTSGTTQAADFVAPLFGHPFKQGDIPAGTYPHFKTTTGLACPVTLFNISRWDDGSMKLCSVLMRVPASVASSSTLSIQVRSGGNAPATGVRTLAEVSAAAIAVDIDIVDPAEGVYTTTVAGAITAADDIVVYGNGPAGAMWRIGGYLRDTGSAAHSQFYAHHYVIALTNANGTLRGLRYLGGVSQPWATAGDLPARYRDLSADLRVGATVVRSMLGCLTSETPVDVFRVPHYAGFFTAGVDARYDYIQAAGSASTDCTIQILHDVQYLQDTNVVPPTQRIGSVESTDRDYRPMGRGDMLRSMGTTGGRPDIGLITGWCARYLANQSANNEKSIRVQAMCSFGWRMSMRKRDTRNVVPVSAMRASYAGLGTTETTWNYSPSVGRVGFVGPSPQVSLWSEDGAHRPQVFLVPYVITGEPHILDLAMQNAVHMHSTIPPGIKTMITDRPTTRPSAPWVGDRDARVGSGPVRVGGGFAFVAGRVGAWGARDVSIAAAIAPEVMADGSETNLYVKDLTSAIHQSLTDYATNMPNPHRTDGLFLFQNNGSTDVEYESPWQIAFWNIVLCWQSGIWSSASVPMEYMLRRYVRAYETFDLGNMITYRLAQFDENENLMTGINQWLSRVKRQLSFDATTNVVTILARRASPENDAHDWTPTNGDLIGFSPQIDANNPFPQFGRNKRLYVVNASGQTFQISETLGGAPLDISTDMVTTFALHQWQNASAQAFASNDIEYIQATQGALEYHAKRGQLAAVDVRDAFTVKAVAAGLNLAAVSQFNFGGV